MSIATEITALNNNLTAAKNAVTAKGGTVGNTGLAGLATEIAGIPSGGTLDNYGTVKYLDSNDVEQTVTMATEEDFFELCNRHGYQSLVHINGVSFAKSKIQEVELADGVTFIPDNFLRYCQECHNVVLPDSIVYIGDYFCHGSSLHNELNLKNVKYIGGDFCSGLNSYNGQGYNQPISLPKVEFIDGNFLYGNAQFNSTVSLNDNCRSINGQFLYSCWGYKQPFTMPSGLEDISPETNPGSGFMRECRTFIGPLVCNSPYPPTNDNYTLSTTSSSAALYTTGVTLTGPYAQAWKDALPDRTSSPYRKLIVGS